MAGSGGALDRRLLGWLRIGTNARSASVSTKRLTGGFFGWITGVPGRVYVYLSSDDAVGAAGQFSRYGILREGELPGPGDDRICGVTFEFKQVSKGEINYNYAVTKLARSELRSFRAVSLCASELQVVVLDRKCLCRGDITKRRRTR